MTAEPLVFVSAHPRLTDYGKDIGVELRGTDDGGLVGIAFSSLQRLVAALGEYQPWVAMERERFTAFVGAAVAADVTAGAAGLGMGALTVVVATGPGILVAAGAGAVAVGVGAFVYQGFHEHWSEDIHDHGVAAGIGLGVVHMGSHAGKEFADIGKGIGGAATSAWRSVFG